MSFQIYWPLGFDQDTVVDCLSGWLELRGYEVNRAQKDWRVMMYRQHDRQWTQLYTGLTTRGKAPRSRLRVTGPEEAALYEVENGFYADGVFESASEFAAPQVSPI